MKSLITGGAGFIGSHLAEQLLARGEDVCVIDNLSTGSRDNIEHLIQRSGFSFVEGSILDQERLEPLVRECDVVYHLAAAVGMKFILANPLASLHTNVRGTDIVLELACKCRKKVFLASTSEVYGKSGFLPLRESDDRVLGPTTVTRWNYSMSKAIDECLALAYHQEMGLSVVIGRFFNIVGPRQMGRYGMVLPTFAKQAISNQPMTIYGDGEQIRTFTYVDDAVEAVTRLMREPAAAGEIFNIGSSNTVTINELALRVKQTAQSSSIIQYIPYEKAYGSNFEDVRQRVPDVTKLLAFTGYEPDTSLDAIIRRVVEYYSEKCEFAIIA